MVVGVLAVLKAGGAYVPLDARLSPRAARVMLRDLAGPGGGWRTAPCCPRGPRIRRSRSWMGSGRRRRWSWLRRRRRSPEAPRGGNLAYVIYTSGSMGLPEGVTLGHAAPQPHALAPGAAGACPPGAHAAVRLAELRCVVSRMFSTWASGRDAGPHLRGGPARLRRARSGCSNRARVERALPSLRGAPSSGPSRPRSWGGRPPRCARLSPRASSSR